MDKKVWIAVATLMGTVIGAGVLGIPYIVAESGFLNGLIDIVFIGIAVLFVNLYLGEVTLRTKGNHQLPGYAKIYLGKWGKALMAFSMIFGVYGALIAYLMGEGEVINAIFNTPPLLNSLIFFLVVAFLVYFGLKTVGKSEMIVTSFLVAFVILLGIFSLARIEAGHLATFNMRNIFVPYGIILFAFIGMAAVPEMKEELTKNRKEIKKAIIIGSIIPIVIYILFTVIVVGMVGLKGFNNLAEDQKIATVALSLVVGKKFAIFANLFAICSMGTSFLVLSLALKEMYHYDYRFSKNLSWFAVCFLPLAVFLLDAFVIDITNFIGILGIVGSISGGISGILIVVMFWRAKKKGDRKPEYMMKEYKVWELLLIAMFLMGMVYEIVSLF